MSDRTTFLDGVFDRTLDNLRSLRGAWRDIAASARDVITSNTPRPELSREDAERLRQRLRDCLDGRGGEVAARARAADLGRIYLALNETGRERFLSMLAAEFDIDHAAVDELCHRVVGADREDRAQLESKLREALEAPRVKLLTQFNALPEGVKFLVDMRAELMPLARTDPVLAGFERDLKSLLMSWFDVGFLELKRITWDSPAALLEKLMRYEAVHEIRSWADLKNRLDTDRRCFAYFHPRMPEEPLIFVEVALVEGISGNVQALLDEKAPVGDPGTADTAIFYSISNCQCGLSGISFGDFLIKRVVDRLAAELPHIKTYATLSPIPGFRTWLEKQLAEGVDLMNPAERKAMPEELTEEGLGTLLARPRWWEDETVSTVLRGPLVRLCARYLVNEKRRSGTALDSVAHFHLSNGARVERLDWGADFASNGLKQSYGIMVNYLYRLSEIEENHEAYIAEHRVTASGVIQRLAKI